MGIEHSDGEPKALVVAGPVLTVVPSPIEAGVLNQAGAFTTARTEDLFDADGNLVETRPAGDGLREEINSLLTGKS